MGEEKRNMRLSDQAAAEFARESADERESQRRELEEAAAKFTSPVELYEGATAQIALFVAVGILLLAIMFMAGTLQLSAKAICLVCGLLCLVFGIHVLMRRKNAVATLTPTGVLFSGTQRELPWEEIDDVDYQGAHSIVQMSAAIFFHLREGIEPPAFSGGRRVRYITEACGGGSGDAVQGEKRKRIDGAADDRTQRRRCASASEGNALAIPGWRGHPGFSVRRYSRNPQIVRGKTRSLMRRKTPGGTNSRIVPPNLKTSFTLLLER